MVCDLRPVLFSVIKPTHLDPSFDIDLSILCPQLAVLRIYIFGKVQVVLSDPPCHKNRKSLLLCAL
jgi:hypothetical protein